MIDIQEIPRKYRRSVAPSKGDYVRCGFMARYCSYRCIHCQQGSDDDGKVVFYCWYPYNIAEKPALPIIKKEIAHFDEFGNIYQGEVW